MLDSSIPQPPSRLVLDALSRRPEASQTASPQPTSNLRACRIEAGLIQPQLAIRARIARETIARLENGHRARSDVIRRLAGALSVPVGVLCGGSGDSEAAESSLISQLLKPLALPPRGYVA